MKRREDAQRTLVSALVVAAVAVALLFVWYARDVLLLVFAGLLVAVFLRRLAMFVSARTPLPPAVALALVVVALGAVLIGAFWLQGGTIVEESQRLRETLPRAVQELRARIAGHELGERLIESVPDAESLVPDDSDAIARVTGVVSGTFSVLASGVIVLFLGIVFAATPGVYVRGVLALFPAPREPRVREVLAELADTLWWWLVGRVIAMAFIGIVTGVGLALLGVPLVFILALLAALLSFIPNLGPILAALPAVVLGLLEGPQTGLWVAGLYAGVQVIETYLLAPIIDRKTISLPPALTIVAQLVMALFAGVLGVALATPLVAAGVVLVTMLYVQDVLGRHEIDVESHGRSAKSADAA